ncbi:MAG: hypothetical protein LBO81_07525, partial [Clostridiales Family XIII bacterium]|nr:hypothetical protein [Clostridiales Family XIII bacterium]
MFNRKEINRNGASGCGNGREKHTFGKRPLVFVAALMLIVTSAVPSFVLADSAGDGDASAAYTVRFCASGTLIKETNVEIPSEAQSV